MGTLLQLPARTPESDPRYESLVEAFELLGYPPLLAREAAAGYLAGPGPLDRLLLSCSRAAIEEVTP